jgi:glucose-1-phosphate cytidylyltransferase
MKVAVLAGGAGTRLAEETEIRPKPMVEIGGMPILLHIMRHYAHYGHKEFFVALGYRGEYIKRYMSEYIALANDLTIDFNSGSIRQHEKGIDQDWLVHLIDTGRDTLTGGRIKRLQPYLDGGTFMLTWGDGVSDVDLDSLLKFHRSHGKLATVTVVRPPARYGHIHFDGDCICEFLEKPQTAEGWINGAFFVLEPGIFDYISGDMVMWEHDPMQQLARDGQLMGYRHYSFWQCMDTLRDKQILINLWNSGNPPWKTWE